MAKKTKEPLGEISFATAKSQMDTLISTKTSFVIKALGGEMLEASKFVEKAIESRGLSCRVYTRNRAYVATAASWTGAGLLSLAAIAAHNLATYSPDYEIGRSIVDNKLYVEFKK